jgi:phospholipid/cholesterol/gamma-HCH transport system substrate-binding protein
MNIMSRQNIETIVGALVLFGAAYFLYFAYHRADMAPAKSGYNVIANFERSDGLVVGSDVSIAGVKIGQVQTLTLDPATYKAKVALRIAAEVKLPKDSSAQIVSDGLLGGKYVVILPGAEEAFLAPQEEIQYTQSSVNLETLIGKMMFDNSKPKTE